MRHVAVVPADAADFTVGYDLYMSHQLMATGVTAAYEAPTDDDAERGRAVGAAILAAPSATALASGLLKDGPGPWTEARAAALAARLAEAGQMGQLVVFRKVMDLLPAFYGLRRAILDDFPSVIRKVDPRSRVSRPGGGPEIRGSRQYGQWDEALRTLAGYDPDLIEKRLAWHLRDFLLAWENHAKENALVDYRHNITTYAQLAPHAKKGTLKPPRVPRVLRRGAQNGQ